MNDTGEECDEGYVDMFIQLAGLRFEYLGLLLSLCSSSKRFQFSISLVHQGLHEPNVCVER